MLPRERPDHITVAFDDHRLVANAGLILLVTLARHLGPGELLDNRVDLGDVPGRANPGDKLLTLAAVSLAGGPPVADIDDADALCAGRTERVLGCVVKAPSTLGTFLRSFWWGHVRQLDRMTWEALARGWAAGAGPGTDPLTIDLGLHPPQVDETYGLCKEGAQRHSYAGQRGYHLMLAVAAGAGEVLMARLRQGRANTAPRRGRLPARDGEPGTPCPRHGSTHRAGQQRLLQPCHCRRLTHGEGPLLHHRPSATQFAEHHRDHTRGRPDAHPVLDGGRRRRGRD